MSDLPSYFPTGGTAAPKNSDATGALWQNFAGLNLKSGESIVINGEAVHFHSWGDGVPSVMQVLPFGVGNNLAFLRQVRAHEVWSIAREVPREVIGESARESGTAGQQNPGALSNTVANTVANTVGHSSSSYINSHLISHGSTPLEELVRPETNGSNTIGNSENNPEGTNPQRLSENRTGTPLQSSQPYTQTSAIPSPSQPPIPEPAASPEPTPNAWEVWTYLERQRQTTLKHLHTFRAEWEANRFVREAERSAPDHLRVHYEIRPVVKSEDEPSPAHDVPLQDVAVPSSPYPRTGPSSAPVSKDNPEVDHTDAIDVEILDS